jgi:hypothetical protein
MQQWAERFQIRVAAAPQSTDAASRVVAKIAKPTGSKLVKGQAESGEICSVEVEGK